MSVSRGRPILYAHRGAAAEQPENTMPSFERALELGADALEMDVHMSSDGHLVVSHDPTGARMCDVPAAIRESPLATVQGWDAGWGFVDATGARPFAGRGYRMPTFEQVLAELGEVTINVDLKQPRPSIVRAMLHLLRAHRAEERVTLASFHLRTLLEVRARGFGGTTALSQAEVAALVFSHRRVFAALPLTGTAAQIPVRVGPLVLGKKRIIDKCHQLGMRVDFWTINDPTEARELLAIGADGIMTDDPAAIAPVFDRYKN